ncbi:TPA: hypothetical protein ACG3KH_004097, partial [Clostridioides difficile]
MNYEISMAPVSLSTLAQKFNCRVIGEDIIISKLGNLSSATSMPEKKLTFSISQTYTEHFNTSNIGACIVDASVVDSGLCVSTKSYLVSNGDSERLFYKIFLYFYQEKAFQTLEERIGVNNLIASNAVIEKSVIIGNDCVIMDNVVIKSNTVIGDRVTIKANSVIGGDGFQVKDIEGKRRIIPHVGGVFISDDVEIGSCVTVDKGLFGEFTRIDEEVKIDNLVNIAHSSHIGRRTIIAAGVTIAGGVTIGSNVFIGMQASINQLLTISDFCIVGAHAAIINSVKAHQKVVGVPARGIGWVCCCGHDISTVKESALLFCPKCGDQYFLNEEGYL